MTFDPLSPPPLLAANLPGIGGRIKAEPDELRNRIDDPKYAAKVKELGAELQRLMEATGALPDRMPLDEGIKETLPDLKIR